MTAVPSTLGALFDHDVIPVQAGTSVNGDPRLRGDDVVKDGKESV